MGVQQEKQKEQRRHFSSSYCVSAGESIFERAAEVYDQELAVTIFGGKPDLNSHALNLSSTDEDPCWRLEAMPNITKAC